MASGLNQCNFIGNLGRDPEVRYTQDGKAVANFSIGVTEKWKDNEKTEWVKVVCFGKLGEIVGKYLTKGRQVFVSGRQQTRSWEKDGVTRYSTEIVASEMRMLGSRDDTRQNDSTSSQVDAFPETPGDDSEIPF